MIFPDIFHYFKRLGLIESNLQIPKTLYEQKLNFSRIQIDLFQKFTLKPSFLVIIAYFQEFSKLGKKQKVKYLLPAQFSRIFIKFYKVP